MDSLFSISDILAKRIQDFKSDPEQALKTKSIKYSKQWNYGVKCFQVELNNERKKSMLPELSFIAVRSKLVALKEIDDLRWFFYHCRKYAKTKDKQGKWNSFSKCFFGALKTVDK